ncbi:DNA-binding protein [Helicobacter aurati]|uniref:DNA-binding protein n=1 Tax=Helicobacter aurati TaxID=137778 RepID=A0A3D8J468_9HELI|nr:HU family DNA-binding protein [Helicobacter aurati]RDU72279.1 DNA-binding protein [Helicobacter aurati]
MNKSEFIATMREIGEYKEKKEAEKALDSFIKAVESALKANNTVELVGFGKFENVWQKGKEGKVPGSDKTYKTADKWVPKFKPGKALKDEIAKIKAKK